MRLPREIQSGTLEPHYDFFEPHFSANKFFMDISPPETVFSVFCFSTCGAGAGGVGGNEGPMPVGGMGKVETSSSSSFIVSRDGATCTDAGGASFLEGGISMDRRRHIFCTSFSVVSSSSEESLLLKNEDAEDSASKVFFVILSTVLLDIINS